jgi:hypothetical protein
MPPRCLLLAIKKWPSGPDSVIHFPCYLVPKPPRSCKGGCNPLQANS